MALSGIKFAPGKERIFMLIKKFIKLLESGKYKINQNTFIISPGFEKIIHILFKEYPLSGRLPYEYLGDIFKDTDMDNVGCKFGGNWRSEIPFILPKYDSDIPKPLAFPDYIKFYGVNRFIATLKKAFYDKRGNKTVFTR